MMKLIKYVNGSDVTVDCDFNKLMDKITNRKFELEGKAFALEGFTRYIGFRLSRKDKHTSGSGNQDMNLDIDSKKRHVYTEIKSSEQLYYLTKDEYSQFRKELNSRIVR